MRIGRFVHADGPAFGVLEKEGVEDDALQVAEIEGHPFGKLQFTGRRWPLDAVRVLPPLLPTKIAVAELARDSSQQTPFFLKPSSSVTGHLAPVQLPSRDAHAYAAATLAVVIGASGARRLRAEQVPSSILGVTIATNVTLQTGDVQHEHTLQTTGRDSFCPLGPWIDTHFSIAGQRLQIEIDGGERASVSLADASVHPYEVVAELSHLVSLLPGDVVLTGTATEAVRVLPGQTLTTVIKELGELSNPVVVAQ